MIKARQTKITSFAQFTLDDDLLTSTFYPIPRLTLPMAIDAVKAMKDLIDGKQVVALTFSDEVETTDKDARQYFHENGNAPNIIASAYVVDHAWKAASANFMLKLSKQTRPVRVFSNEEQARKWLTRHRKFLAI
jgi:hypothetical protein